MNIPTCYRCPSRKGCVLLAAKRAAVKGAGLTVIKFKCTRREALFAPGQPVSFKVWTRCDKDDRPDGYRPVLVELEGWIWRHYGRKFQVVSMMTDAPVIKLYPDVIQAIEGEWRRCCVHCGKPEGVADRLIRKGDSGESDYICRYTDGVYTIYGTEVTPPRPMLCEYRVADGGVE